MALFIVFGINLLIFFKLTDLLSKTCRLVSAFRAIVQIWLATSLNPILYPDPISVNQGLTQGARVGSEDEDDEDGEVKSKGTKSLEYTQERLEKAHKR